jgi:hypothetical protein
VVTHFLSICVTISFLKPFLHGSNSVTELCPTDVEWCCLVLLLAAMRSSRAKNLVSMQLAPILSATLSVSETLGNICELTRMIAGEDFITKHGLRESLKSYLLFTHLDAYVIKLSSIRCNGTG